MGFSLPWFLLCSSCALLLLCFSCFLSGSVGEGNGTPLQSSCLENPRDRGARWAAVHGVAKSQTRLRDFTFTFHFHALTHSSVLAWRIPGMGEPGGLLSLGSHRVGHDWATSLSFHLLVVMTWCSYFHAAAKSLQSCPTLCNPIDGSPPGSPVPGILQARTLEWVTISFSIAWKWSCFSRVQLCVTP